MKAIDTKVNVTLDNLKFITEIKCSRFIFIQHNTYCKIKMLGHLIFKPYNIHSFIFANQIWHKCSLPVYRSINYHWRFLFIVQIAMKITSLSWIRFLISFCKCYWMPVRYNIGWGSQISSRCRKWSRDNKISTFSLSLQGCVSVNQ